MTKRPPPRRCAECRKILGRRTRAVVVEISTTPAPPRYRLLAYPLCSVACGAVAAVRLLEQVRG